MSIAWAYLDKRAASVDALKDYSIMEFIIRNHREQMAEKRTELTSCASSALTGLPKVKNPNAGEGRLASMIDEINVLAERYRQALEYMEWFQPAWDELSEDDQFVLTAFYRTIESAKQNPIDLVCDHYHIERSSAYNKKNRALAHLSSVLYGKL